MANVPFIDDGIFSPTLLAVSALTFLSEFTPFMMFLRLLSVSREKGLWVARALGMVTGPSHLLFVLPYTCLTWSYLCSVLQSKTELSSETLFCLASLGARGVASFSTICRPG